MSSTIHIRCKATGELFDVPYELHTTIQQLIEYVCTHSTALADRNSNDYYMAINDCDTLDDHRTVKELNLDQPNESRSLNVCIKTRILMERIRQSHMQLWQVPEKQKSDHRDRKQDKHFSEDKASTTDDQPELSAAATWNDRDLQNEVHILVCGGPNVGKSTLINAFCGCPVAKINTNGLDRCTQKLSSYQLNNIYFWDTPGIQEWSHIDIDSYLNSFGKQQTPICMFYCASPGSFAKLKQLDVLLDQCINRRQIFCVLVVTNMYASVARKTILDEFKKLLTHYVRDTKEIREENGIWYFGQIGLCAMVNSQEFVNEDTDRRYLQQGIHELVLALTKSFRGTNQLDGWLKTIEQNQLFWLNNQEELFQLTKKPPETCLTEMIKGSN